MRRLRALLFAAVAVLLVLGSGAGNAEAQRRQPKAGAKAGKDAKGEGENGKDKDKGKEQEKEKDKEKAESDAKDAKGKDEKSGEGRVVGADTKKSGGGPQVVEEKEGGETGVKTYKFGPVDVEGRLKSPQIVYFLRRVRAEFAAGQLGHRSFLGELRDTRRNSALK
jgi:hypothetical protein